MHVLSKVEGSQLQGGPVRTMYISDTCFVIVENSVWPGAGSTSEQLLDQVSLPGTKFGASKEPQHTTHTQGTQEHIYTQQQMEKLFRPR